jgi:hypothetical protein
MKFIGFIIFTISASAISAFTEDSIEENFVKCLLSTVKSPNKLFSPADKSKASNAGADLLLERYSLE